MSTSFSGSLILLLSISLSLCRPPCLLFSTHCSTSLRICISPDMRHCCLHLFWMYPFGAAHPVSSGAIQWTTHPDVPVARMRKLRSRCVQLSTTCANGLESLVTRIRSVVLVLYIRSWVSGVPSILSHTSRCPHFISRLNVPPRSQLSVLIVHQTDISLQLRALLLLHLKPTRYVLDQLDDISCFSAADKPYLDVNNEALHDSSPKAMA